MIKDRLRELFGSYDPNVRKIVGEVIELEQYYITMRNPRGIRQDIDAVIEKYAREELQGQDAEETED